MAKHPSLAAACYLISKGGDPEAGEALSKSNDTTVNNILRSFVSNDPRNSTNAAEKQGTNCVLCERSSTSILYNCCNRDCSMFCNDCSQKLRICPCCSNRLIQWKRPSTKSVSNSLELPSSPPDTFTNNFSPYSSEFEDHDDLIDSRVFLPSLPTGKHI